MSNGVGSLSAIQATNARAIVNVGQSLGFPDKAAVIAIATALQESDLGADPTHSAPDKNHDAGVFQQRVLPGWYGTLAQVNDINYSARVFYTGKKLTASDVKGARNPAGPIGYTIPGLAQVKGWEFLSVTTAAQAVQRSAFPMAYAKHETRARQIVADIKGGKLGPGLPNTGSGIPGLPENLDVLGGFKIPEINWASVFMMLVGIVVTIVALIKITGVDSTVISAADTAAKTYTGGIVGVK